MATEPTTIEDHVEFGLEKVPEQRRVEVSLRDLLYVFQTMGEFVRFFHQPDHYPDLESIQTFLGNRDSGALHVLFESYYKRLSAMLPPDVEHILGEGAFDHPTPPSYFHPRSGGGTSSPPKLKGP